MTENKRMTIELPDGYNGHTIRFYSEPLEEHARCVKLQVSVIGKEYMTAWRDKIEWQKAVTREEKRIARQSRANQARKERDQIRRDMGLVRVRGALGGIYWE